MNFSPLIVSAIVLYLSGAIRIIDAHRTGNQKFKVCCARQKDADKACKRKFCDFNAIRQDNMLFYLSTCSIKGATVRRMWDCASSRIDHTECCKNNNVQSECLVFCNATNAVPEDYYNHLHCLQSFGGIRNCFQSYLNEHPNIFGDN
uniref:DB domain-containing protein n=1 Tax=Ascaris lumbricoides TaxID=6252 RepID=A0A0M3HWX6_ASCLU